MSRSLLSLAVLAALLLPAPALVAQDNTGPAEPAYLTVKLPADAKLQIGDRLTQQTAATRRFVSPPLPVNSPKRFTYVVKVTFKDEDGKDVTKEQTVQVTPGQTAELAPTTAKADDKAKGGDKPKADDKAKGEEKKPKRPPDVIFVGTPVEVVEEMLKVANVKKEDLLYDLGCGEGIIVITASKKVGCKTVGYEIDSDLVKVAKEKVKEAKVEDLCTIEEKDIFTLDLTKATVIATYLLDDLNGRLVPQLKKMKEGTRIVMHDYDIPGYKPDKTTKVDVKGKEHRVHLYTIPLNKK